MTEKHTCPRRIEMGMDRADGPFPGAGTNLDTYEVGHGLVDQALGCSYCGSMSPSDFMEAVRSKKQIGPTDKNYKLYVGDHEGKFYTPHLSEEQGWEFHKLWTSGEINWGYPGYAYVPLFIPGPSTKKEGDDGTQS